MPVYNERNRVAAAVSEALAAELPPRTGIELVIVDDGSTDGTVDILRELAARRAEIKLIEHGKNAGKGAAIRTAIKAATGDFAIFQDADLEYDPADYRALLGPLLDGSADAVFGSRYAARTISRVMPFWHTRINKFLTGAANVAGNVSLTDMETCYKAYRMEVLRSIPLRSDRFGMEPELTIKTAKRGLTIYEVPISYRPRSVREGKKITAWDGVKALGVIARYWAIDDLYDDYYGHAILHRLSGAQRFNSWMADAVRPFLGKDVLEIGSGMGNMTQELTPRDRYTATDIDALHLRQLHNRYGRRPGMNVATLNLEKESDFQRLGAFYDSVVCLNVLEHVEKDVDSLRNIRSVLKPGGRAVVLVPRGKWLFGSLDVVLGHFRRYDEAELRSKAEEAGLEMEKIFDFNRAAVPGWFFNARVMRRRHFGYLQLKLFDSLVFLLRRFDRFLPWRGVSWIAVMRNPDSGAQSAPARRAA
jgi:glycosyltransferase involved in cell wall biosynthesis